MDGISVDVDTLGDSAGVSTVEVVLGVLVGYKVHIQERI